MDSFFSRNEIEELIDRLTDVIGDGIVKETKRESLRRKSGRVYMFQGRKHIASNNKSTEVFANRSGKLKNSLRYETNGDVITVGSDIKYLKYLELGTVKMNIRPSLDLGVTGAKIEDLITRELDRFFR